MPVPQHIADRYYDFNVMLASRKAQSDAHRGITDLEKEFGEGKVLFSSWRVRYAGICSLLRASIHLISVDAKSCMNDELTAELKAEWNGVKKNPDDHAIYWKFVNKERNNILKEYHWTAYEQFYNDKRVEDPEMPITGELATLLTATRSELKISSGEYNGRNAIDVLIEASVWAEERTTMALARAGYKPTDRVHFRTWQDQPEQPADGLMTLLASETRRITSDDEENLD